MVGSGASENRSVFGCALVLSCLALAFSGCGESSTPGGSDDNGSDAGAGGSSSGPCVSITGGGVEPWHDLTVYGTGFDADEGETMRTVVATEDGNRVGIAELPIVDGAFTLSMPEVLNDRLYVGIAFYMDRNDDDTCELDEHVWDWTTRIVMGDLRFDITPDEICDTTNSDCRSEPSSQGPCLVGTGDTDLTEPLPCDF